MRINRGKPGCKARGIRKEYQEPISNARTDPRSLGRERDGENQKII
jgi:hypothetical protein